MTFLNGITLLLVYQLAGEASVLLLQLPVPGPVMGMIMLFLTLLIRGRSADSLDSASSALLGHLSLLFVPAGVGIMVYFDRLADEWLAISAALLAGTLITLLVTAALMQAISQLLAKRVNRNG